MRFSRFLLLGILFLSINSFGQISFTNNSTALENQALASGFSMGVSDMNGDGLDDIIRFGNAIQLEIEHQDVSGNFNAFNVGNLIDSDVWSVCIADIDGNGYNDLMTGGFYEACTMLKTTAPETYEMELLDGPYIFMQGSNFVDINNDGNIDYFACHDDEISSPYKGDGNTLAFDENLIVTEAYMDAGAGSNSGNYASTWIDYDNDNDLDLYLSKCRLSQGGDPTHPSRVNLMFRNDGGGIYTEVAEEIGLRPFGQTWASEFGDIDNDGDLDVMIVNHDVDSKLYLNDGLGNYTDISASAGIELNISNFPSALQVYMQDFDNDTYLDIMVTSYSVFPKLYHNNGDNTFTEVMQPWGTDVNTVSNNGIQSAAMGDLNNDGFVDMIVGFANGINIPNIAEPDRLYLGDTNNNNYCKVNLQGILSNDNGIGAKVIVNGSWGSQMREIRSGHSYGVMNSLTAMFGLGEATEISSIEVRWPSGTITTLDNPMVNTTHLIVESNLTVQYDTQNICEGKVSF